jgi:hypothetical protein
MRFSILRKYDVGILVKIIPALGVASRYAEQGYILLTYTYTTL